MAYATRRSYAGAAPSCTLTNTIASGDTTISLTGDVTNWNTTANGPFYAVIDPGLATEEKILVASRSSTVLSSITRGVDGTAAAAHTAGAICYPVFTAVDADQANAVASALTTKGDLLVTTGSILNRLAVGTNAYALLADSTATNGVAWGQVAAGGIADSAITSAKIADGAIINGDINASAAIAHSKLANATSGQVLLGTTTTGVVTATTVSGDVTITGAGVTAIASGVIVDADINASAAIADTKLATIATAGKVSNSATTAASANTASAIVARDASGNFTAGTITAALTGTASGNLVSGGALGTPSSGTLTNCTFPTLNQNTTGSAGSVPRTGITGIKFGVETPTLNGSKQGTFNHGLGTTPTGLVMTNGNLAANSGYPAVISVSSTQVNFEAVGGVAGNSFQVNYIAW